MEAWMWIVLAAVALWLHGYSAGRKRMTRDVGDAMGMIRSMFAGK